MDANARERAGPSHAGAGVLLALVVLGFLSPLLLRGFVVFPHDNTLEVGLAPPKDPERVSNRDFNDQSSVFVPEIHQHLNGRSAGWISTWNPHVELGRPTFQIAGTGKAFPLITLLSWFTHDSLRVYSAEVVVALGLTALFAFLLCRALGLAPVPCLVAALGLGLGIFTTYWMTFVLFTWSVCWTLALLWLVARELECPPRRSWSRLLGIACALYLLLLSGYPQQIVWHVWVLVGFTVWRLTRLRTCWRARALGLARLGAAVALGVLAVAPVYLDVALNAQLSARLGADTAFFLQILPKLDGWRNVAGFLLQRFDPFWLGNPIDPDYLVRFNGVAPAPPFLILAALTLGQRDLVRRLWPVQLFCAGALLLTIWPAAYAFGVEHLGLSLSRLFPLAGALIPLHVLAAYGAQSVLSKRALGPGTILVALLLAVLVAAAAVELEDLLVPSFVLAGAALSCATLALVRFPRPWPFVLLAVLTTLHYGPRLALWRPIEDVRRTSPLVEFIAQETKGGRRYALVSGGYGTMLPSNQEAFLGLRSIHSYNSLSPRSYQDWTRRISPEGTKTYGRLFTNLSSDELLGGPELSFAGVALFLSGKPMKLPGLRPAGNYAGALVYDVQARPPMEAQASDYALAGDGAATIAGELGSAGLLPVRRVTDLDDRLAFELTISERETLLFVSQKHHPQWRAFAGERELECVSVNDFYLGVRVPASTSRVELEFLPWVRWSWVPQVGFALAGAAVCARAALQRSWRRSR